MIIKSLKLDVDEGFKYLDTTDSEAGFEKNRLDMYKANCWGAPTFKLFHNNNNILSIWGQDRIWVVEEELKKL